MLIYLNIFDIIRMLDDEGVGKRLPTLPFIEEV